MELAKENAWMVLSKDRERIKREEGRTIGAVKEKKADQSDESFLAALETTFGKANTMVQEDVKG